MSIGAKSNFNLASKKALPLKRNKDTLVANFRKCLEAILMHSKNTLVFLPGVTWGVKIRMKSNLVRISKTDLSWKGQWMINEVKIFLMYTHNNKKKKNSKGFLRQLLIFETVMLYILQSGNLKEFKEFATTGCASNHQFTERLSCFDRDDCNEF